MLRPYYKDVNYASNPSQTDSIKLRSKTPAQLLDKFDPLPSNDIQKKIDYFFRPYTNGQVQHKYMSFSYNEKEELLTQLRQKLQNHELPKIERTAITELIEQINNKKNWIDDSEFENPALCIHNLVFQENDKKRYYVIEQLRIFTQRRMKEMGMIPSSKIMHIKKLSKSHLRKDKNNSFGKLFTE